MLETGRRQARIASSIAVVHFSIPVAFSHFAHGYSCITGYGLKLFTS
jgi:hypothetical protein